MKITPGILYRAPPGIQEAVFVGIFPRVSTKFHKEFSPVFSLEILSGISPGIQTEIPP